MDASQPDAPRRYVVTEIRLYQWIFWVLLTTFSTGTFKMTAQTCEGSLGANIFAGGDFGAGVDNFLLVDPMIAPGYTYTTNPPPQDGLYTITNNTGSWSSLFPTWLEIADPSVDPNGYMMVVNASLQPGLFYEETVDGLCENTLYDFSADIINMIIPGVPDHIQPNVSFLIDDQIIFSSGGIPQDGRWHTYGFTFTTEPGQNSVKLSLQNNAPGGIGNDLALDNISFRPCGPEVFILPETVANICEDGDPLRLEATVVGDEFDQPAFQWQLSRDSASWSNISGAVQDTFLHSDLQSGFYYYRVLLASQEANLNNTRCISISNVKTIFVQPKFFEIHDTLCQGESYQQGNNQYLNSGTFTDSLISVIGCDSIVTLHLTIINDPDINVEFTTIDLTCFDVPSGEILIDTITGSMSPYRVYFEDSLVAVDRGISMLNEGNYQIKVADRFGCVDSFLVEVGSAAPFHITLGPDLDIVFGDSVTLSALGNYPVQNYSWQVSQDFNCADPCNQLQFIPFQSQTVIVAARSEQNCVASDSIMITVVQQRDLYLPNAFSPNGDGQNDYFNVFGRSEVIETVEQLSIFDRWGGQIWASNDVIINDFMSGWNGRGFDGKVNPGVYTYKVRIRYVDGQTQVYAGDVTLLD